MGKKDTLHWAGGLKETAVNIHFRVGPGVENGPADVKTIQTMFHYLANLHRRSSFHLFGMSKAQLPSVSGRCGRRTQQAILNFQIRHAKRLMNVDGLIHPASYDERKLAGGPEKRFMTITLLRFLATDANLHFGDVNYFEGLIKITPELRSWLT